MLSIREISQRLNLPESTVRYYRDNYDKFLPSSGDGKKKRYTEECIEIFSQISSLVKNGKSKQDIIEFLSSDVIDISEETASTATTAIKNAGTQQQVLIINDVLRTLDQIQDVQNEAKSLQQESAYAVKLIVDELRRMNDIAEKQQAVIDQLTTDKKKGILFRLKELFS